MSEIDRIFSRFQENKPASNDRREVLNLPRRGGVPGSRVVEVVHVRSGASSADKDRARRKDLQVRAATWEDGFPTKQAPQLPPLPEPVLRAEPAPRAHVMPMWEPAAAEVAADAATAVMERKPAPARRTSPRQAERRVADPYDAQDDGANCMRCGYAIEPARERRGLLTCSGCG